MNIHLSFVLNRSLISAGTAFPCLASVLLPCQIHITHSWWLLTGTWRDLFSLVNSFMLLERCLRYDSQQDQWKYVTGTNLANGSRYQASSVVMPNGDWVIAGGQFQVCLVSCLLTIMPKTFPMISKGFRSGKRHCRFDRHH